VDIGENRLRDELVNAAPLNFVEPYEEFLCGRPTRSEGQIMLWTPGGVTGDGIITHYDGEAEAAPTEYGRRLPYVTEIIERFLSVRHLRFARLVALTSNVLIPHRDYLEFGGDVRERSPMHRLHIPLITNSDCMFSEDNRIYRMRAGEVWFLDATRVHSAAALTDEVRMHLIVDFAGGDNEFGLLKIESSHDGAIPANCMVDRKPLTESEREALYTLATVIDEDNLREIFGIVAKLHFRRDGGDDFFWRTIAEIRRRVPDAAFAAKLAKMHEYFVLERDA
jgi:hypothetical protein